MIASTPRKSDPVLPLGGVTVLAFSQFLAGPSCASRPRPARRGWAIRARCPIRIDGRVLANGRAAPRPGADDHLLETPA